MMRPSTTFILLSSSSTLVEIAGLASYDYMVVDMEDDPSSFAKVLPYLRILDAAHTPTILYLLELFTAWAKKALDLDPRGLMFLMIKSPATAKLDFSFHHFPPCSIHNSTHTAM